MSEAKGNRNAPKSLTTKQHDTVAKFIKFFPGDTHKRVKKVDLKKASKSILGTLAPPAWITRNPNVRLKGDGNRGLYDLSVLSKLPAVDPVVRETPAPKKAATKKEPAAPKVPAKKKAATKKEPAAPAPEQEEDPIDLGDEEPIDSEDGLDDDIDPDN